MADPWLNSTPWDVRLIPYIEGLDSRSLVSINYVIVHATETPTLAEARRFGEEIHYLGSQTGNCGHFYVDTDGHVECWVTPDRIAHHVKGHNHSSIGIELVHPGRYPDWYGAHHQDWTEPYPAIQIEALITLLNQLSTRLPQLHHIAGHDELDTSWVSASDQPDVKIRRKLDPGPTFPWEQVLAGCDLTRPQPLN